MPETCRIARDEIEDLLFDDGPRRFFPLDRLRGYFKHAKVLEILLCSCPQCQEDLRLFGNQTDPRMFVNDIMGGAHDPNELTYTHYSVFGLLVYVEHPLLIIGFLERDCSDFLLESWVHRNTFDREALKKYTGDYKGDPVRFERFARRFDSNLAKFAVPHLESSRFVQYDDKVVLPFIEEREIGQKKVDDGHWTSEGANGRVFAFKVHREYCKFPGIRHQVELARKQIATPQPQAFLERGNIQYVQKFEDPHIVKLIKAYGYGGTINLIFPKALTNLDHLLREPEFGYDRKRGAKLELADAWQQLLGIAKALKKIQGFGEGADSRTPASVDDRLCIHFDLKPDNILVEKVDGYWIITDFGQAALTQKRRGTTPRIGGHFGTDAYAPPEIEDTSMEFGRAYDIWSLGCIMLEVTTFMILGYAGLKGSANFSGLDQARQAMPSWARNGDERFFYREVPHGDYVVKKEIWDFMDTLEHRHARSPGTSGESRKFLKKILDLIKRMLRPNAKDRVDIARVVETLSSALKSASASASDTSAHQVVPAPGETVLGGPELNQIGLWHLSATNRTWEDSHVEALESEAGHIRLHCWAHGHEPKDIYFRRNDVKILPLYAFWDPNHMWDSRTWIDFLFLSTNQVSVVSNAQFSFDGHAGLEDARVVQSKLTSQNIVGSFTLSSVKLTQPGSVKDVTKEARNAFMGLFRPPKTHPTDENHGLLGFGSATIQIWVEEDMVLEKLSRCRTSASQASATSRTVRVFDRVQKPPCRVAIYLHQQKFICTIRVDFNWVLKEDETDSRVLLFNPHPPGRKHVFFASWIRPTQEELDAENPAGIPLNPKLLQYFEDLDCFKAENFELKFHSAEDRENFKWKFWEVKRDWDLANKKLEHRIPVNRMLRTAPQPPDGIDASLLPKKWAQFKDWRVIGDRSAVELSDHDPPIEESPLRHSQIAAARPFRLMPPETDPNVQTLMQDEQNPKQSANTVALRIPLSHLEKDYPYLPYSHPDPPQLKDVAIEEEISEKITEVKDQNLLLDNATDQRKGLEATIKDTSKDDQKPRHETNVDVVKALHIKAEIAITERERTDKATQTEASIRSSNSGEGVVKAIVNVLATNPVLTGMFRYSPSILHQSRLEQRFQHLLKELYTDLMNDGGCVVTKQLYTPLRSRQRRKTIARDVILIQRLPDILKDQQEPSYTDSESDDEEWEGDDAITLSQVAGFAKLDRVLQTLVEGEPFRNLLSGLGKVLLPPKLVEEIVVIPRINIEYSSRERSVSRALLSTVQAFFENVTGLEWDWWPLKPRMPALQDGQSRVYWRCFCGTARWYELRSTQREILEILLQHLPEDSAPRPLCAFFKRTHFAYKSAVNPSGQAAGNRSSASARYTPSGGSSSASNAQGTQPGGNSSAQPNPLPATGGQAHSQSESAQAKRLWVNFGVEGSRITPEFDQIEDHGLLTDPIFLRELRRKHHELRGWTRSHLSFWQLSYWEFVKFEMIPLKPAARIIVKGVDLPEDSEYEYNPRPPDVTPESPPILRHEFEVIVRLCLAPCWFAWLPILHECYTYEDTRNVLLRLPKLNKALGANPKPIWGIQAKYAVSAIRVVIIHVLILCVSFGLLGWWQWKHPEDLQGAAVPLTVAGVLTSTFWSSTGVLSALR